MFKLTFKQKFAKKFAVITAGICLFQSLLPFTAIALTGGPSQPEVESFEPIGTSEMVDLFTGDFVYNIPLLDVGGYPINISYHSGITMDQEASWVGLGWNINPGAINRNMRGIPDDFNGKDKVTKRYNIKPNETYGGSIGVSLQAVGIEQLSLSASRSIFYNNYKGVGSEITITPSIAIAKNSLGQLNAGLGITSSSESGFGLNPSLSLSARIAYNDNNAIGLDASIGTSFSSRDGLKEISFNAGLGEFEVNSKGGFDKRFDLGNAKAVYSFTTPTYIPTINMQMKNSGLTISGTIGSEAIALHPAATLSGYYTRQELLTNVESLAAYGYLNAEKGKNDERALMDFNRSNDLPYNKFVPVLPTTNFTHDIYAVSGQGIGGSFRPFRGDIGALFDARHINISNNESLGIEVGIGAIAHGGAEKSFTNVFTESGKWVDDNPLIYNPLTQASYIDFNTTAQNSMPEYEHVYFKQAGEKNVDADPAFYTSIGENIPVRPATFTGSADNPIKQLLVSDADNSQTRNVVTSPIYRKKRQNRNQHFSYLSIKEKQTVGLEKEIYDYSSASIDQNLGKFTGQSPVDDSTISSAGSIDHHIGEISVVNPDGQRYIYGIPAYNTIQKEVTFAIENNPAGNDCDEGLVQYNSGSDNTIQNTQGIDNYFNEVEIPAYAHSYLLTATLSPDYMDADLIDGPSPGDWGNYTKFNYKRKVDYRWRVPFKSNKATYNEGLKSDD